VLPTRGWFHASVYVLELLCPFTTSKSNFSAKPSALFSPVVTRGQGRAADAAPRHRMSLHS
jgi:hypothetical protein